MTKVNFERLARGISSPANKIVDPRNLFNALSSFNYLRGPQDQVLAAWNERRESRDLVFKMNTGGGKTQVGLFIARSWLNEGVRPVAYIVPDEFLTAQVMREAEKAGIATTDDPNTSGYQQGRAVLVGTFAKVFNGKSVFGVRGSLSKPPSYGLAGVIIDDAQACVAQAEQVFRLKIDANESAYDDLLNLFEAGLREQSPSGYLDLKSGEHRAVQEVPFWTWQKAQSDVLAVLHPLSTDTLKWSWPVVVDCLPLCTAVFTSDALEIYPPCHPTESLLGFSEASRRVYLTATLADDSALVRHFGADKEAVTDPIVPSSAGDIGDRMILVPQQLVPTATDEEVRELVLCLAEKQNVVVIVPSHARADWWRDDAELVLDRHNIHEGIEQLRQNSQLGLVVLVNRYDGIDLPGDACHVLVVDGLPEALAGADRITQARLSGSANLLGRQIQRLEQGMGRATRSNDDYAVVLLLGARLAERLNAPNARKYFSPATRVQLDLAVEVAGEIEAETLDDLHGVIDQCLERDKSWIKYNKVALAEVRYESSAIGESAKHARLAFDSAMRGDYTAAAKWQRSVVNDTEDDQAAKAVQQQQLAAYTNFFDPSKAQQIQKNAHAANTRLLRPLAGVQYEKLIATSRPQGEQASSQLQKRYNSGNELLLGFNALVEDLDWGPRTDQFEQAVRELADHIGFVGQRPEKLPKPGPDNLWAMNDGSFFVIEAKSGADEGRRISKHWAGQLSQAMDWFREQYPNSEGLPVMISPEPRFDSNAAVPPGCRVITTKKLALLREALKSFSAGLTSDDAFRDPSRVALLLSEHKLLAHDFLKRFSVPGRY